MKKLLSILSIAFAVIALFSGIPSACADGETMCFDDFTMVRCIDGYWSEYTQCDGMCNYDTGACYGMDNGEHCTVPNQIRCNPDNSFERQICNADILEWQFYDNCDLGCFNDVCMSCTPNERECMPQINSSAYHYCKQDGQWNSVQYCAQGEICSGGNCIEISTPSQDCDVIGEKRCNPDGSAQIQVCNSNYKWQLEQTCSLACFNDNGNVYCTDCQPNARVCLPQYDNRSYQVCSTKGKWLSPLSCALDEVCQNGMCIKQILPPPDYCPTNGAKRCNPQNANQVDICTGNLWTPFESCSLACYQEGTNAYCTVCTPGSRECTPQINESAYHQCKYNGLWDATKYCQENYVCLGGACVINGDPLACTTPGATRCNPYDETYVQICSEDYLWEDYVGCELSCYDNGQQAYCKQCEYPGQRDCLSTSAYHICNNEYKWFSPNYCSSNEQCIGGYCIGSGCTLGDERCVGDEVWSCVYASPANYWQKLYTCPSGQYCYSEQNSVYCKDKPSTPVYYYGGGSTGGLGAFSFSSTGGGAISQCLNYTAWSADSSYLFNQTFEGKSRQCTNTTLMRWCVGENGKIDYSDSQTNYSIECGSWSDECEYVYLKTEKYMDDIEGNCRTCEKDIYALTCQPSGKVYNSDTKETLSCSAWSACELKASAQPSGGILQFISENGFLLGLLLLLLIALLAYWAWQISEGEEGKGNGQ